MAGRKYVSRLGYLGVLLLALGACSESHVGPTNWRGICVDNDGDGFGFQCAPGSDCNDENADVHTGCLSCGTPTEGCACEANSAPIDCSLPLELSSSGALLCREGTRYCRDQKWTACEGIRSYEAPPPSTLLGGTLQSLGPSDAGTTLCNACTPDCYNTNNPLQTGIDAATKTNIDVRDAGGITLAFVPTEASVPTDAALLDDWDCVPGTAPDSDCDGIPDNFDPSNTEPPFSTDHKTIFMDLAPGESAQQSLEINFNLASADVYFYLDMTGSMEEERDALISSLTSNNYLPSAGVGMNCADRDFDKSPDEELKDQGVAGNIACLIRDARFGAGWFKDIPFTGYGDKDYAMYENRLDITPDVDALQAALSAFRTESGDDYVEGSMQGLWSIATGKENYAGWDRPGVPNRVGCPAGTWGYPCFRNGAVPIVIHVTDQGLHNGPPTTVGGTDYGYAYSTANLTNHLRGTPDAAGNYLRTLTATAETFTDAQDYGTVDGKFITYAGDTAKMRSDLSYAITGNCATAGAAWDTASQTGHDAVFKFTVGSYLSGTTPRTIKLSALGSRFNTSLQLLSAAPTFSTQAASGNGDFTSPYNAGVIAAGSRTVINGDSSSFTSAFAREGMTTGTGCFANATADDVEAASVVKFQLAANSNLRFTTNGVSGVNTALFAAPSMEPTVVNLATLNCGAGASSNCNDKIGQYSIGDISDNYVHLINGNTTDTHLTSDYQTQFNTAGWCPALPSGSTWATASDSVVDFTVSKSTRVLLETSGSGSDMKAGFLHGMLLLKKPPALDALRPITAANGDLATATSIADADLPNGGAWARYSGDSSADTATYVQNEVGGVTANICKNGNVGAASSGKEAVFKLVVPTGGASYEIDTMPVLPVLPTAGYKTWLSIHSGTIARSTQTAITNGSELDTAAGQVVATSSNAINNRQIVLTGGQINLRNKSFSRNTLGDTCGSTTNSTSSPTGGRDAVFSFYASAASTVKITTTGETGSLATAPTFDSVFAVFQDSISSTNRITSNCGSNPAGNAFSRTVTVAAGKTYYIVVKEWKYNTSPTTANSKFGLVIEDAGFTNSLVGCDAGSYPGNSNFSRISKSLTAGTYYLVLKGNSVNPTTKWALNIRKTSATAAGASPMACAIESNGRSTIDTTLAPGDYSVIVKGQTKSCTSCSADRAGAYNLTLRDLSTAPNPIGCHNTANAASFTQTSLPRLNGSGQVIDYYLVTRGNTTPGNYQIVIEDTGLSAIPNANECDNDSGGYSNAQISKQLNPGTYYAVLKGRGEGNEGWFQLSIGEDKSGVTSSGSFTPKTWQGTGGVRDQLLNNPNAKIRVITVNAVHNTSGRSFARTSTDYKQTLVLSKDTGGLTSGATSTYEIGTDGTGMGYQVVSAVNDLVNNLSMDVGVRLNPAPDNPAKPFGFAVEALPNSGNCSSPIDTDGNGVVDTHRACRLGAVPKFRITITNPPAPNNVPLKNNDPTQGYTMTLEIIGDQKFVVDSIPVYIIPSDAIPAPITQVYAQTGTFEQKISAQCEGTARPVWRSLFWNASMPTGTSIDWKVCTAETDTDLANCTLQTAASVTVGNSCTSATDCPNGYCASSGKCEYPVGPACTATSECGTGGVCVSNTCRWTRNPIDLLPALKRNQQGNKFLRMSINMNSSPDRLSAPTVNDWNLDYYCSAAL